MKENRHITPFNFVFKWRNVLKWCNDSGACSKHGVPPAFGVDFSELNINL